MKPDDTHRHHHPFRKNDFRKVKEKSLFCKCMVIFGNEWKMRRREEINVIISETEKKISILHPECVIF